MSEHKYINSFQAILDNCQKEMKDIVGYPDVITCDGWKFIDLSKCNRPCLQGRYKKRKYKYIKAEQIIYIEDIYHCKLNDLAGILNKVKWRD